MKTLRYCIFVALAMLFASCQSEVMPGHVEEGIPTSIDFSISVPSAEEVNVTKASVAAAESEIKELMLIMFEASGRKMVLDLTSYLDAGEVTEGYRKYTLTRPIDTDMYGGKVYSGKYKVYAVANWSSTFASLSDLDKLTEGELMNQIATNPGFVYNITGSNRFPMSSITEGVEINPEGTSTLNIKLKRVVARIEFEFANGTGVQFTPTSYTIYNIPSQANLFSKDNNVLTGLGASDFGKSADIAISSKSFEFFMLENVQVAKQAGCTTQALREAWTGGSESSVTSPESKNFTYAPTHGTFIVVKGSYTDADYIGDVTYTIHLGNFSEQANTANGKDYSNFKVNRNERQKYKVTVNGVNSIVTEVTDSEENQPGAEGALSQKTANTFVLDAHYEKVMMDLSSVDSESKAYLYIDTPYCVDNNGNGLVDLTDITRQKFEALGLDYQWVKFIKPSSASQFPNYSEESAGDVYALIQDIIAGDQTYYAEINGKKMTAAFVDEYFYEMKPNSNTPAVWTEFVNTDNRTMSIRPDVEYSPDGNSSLVQDSHLEISQRSIKTTYAFEGTDSEEKTVYVPFGIETWDETGKIYFYGSAQNSGTGNNYNVAGLTDDNGWSNTWLFTAGQIPANPSKAGYLTSVSDNSKDSHVYSEYIALAEGSRAKGYNACLLRNRDENNDGKISDAELKWYLPAIDQYTSIWLSEDLLHEDTQLFDRANLASASNDLNKNSVFYTSSSSEKRLYWALEGASYGQDYGSRYSNARNSIRCVRNLVSKDKDGMYDDAPSSLTRLGGNDEEGYIVYANNITAVRSINYIGEYEIGHKERSEDNKLPSAFEIAKKYLGENVPVGGVKIPEIVWLKLSNNSGKRESSSSSWRYNYTVSFTVDNIEGDKYVCEGVELNSTNSYTYTKVYSNQSTTNSFTLNVNVTKKDGRTAQIPLIFRFSGSTYNGVTNNEGVEPEHVEYTEYIQTGKGTGSKDKFSVSSFNATDLCAKGYYQQLDKSDLGMWRVPNQREFMLMLQYDLLISDNDEGCVSSTFLNGTFKTQPFSTYGGGITLENGVSSIYIRCVMDAKVYGGDDNTEGGDGGTTPPVVTPPDPGTGEGPDL